MMLKFSSTLFLVLLSIPIPFLPAVLGTDIGIYVATQWAPWNWIVKAFEAIVNAIVSGVRSVIDALLVEPLLKFGAALPVFDKGLANAKPYFLSSMLSNAMSRVYSYTVATAYGILAVALALSGFWILGEAADLARQGEGMATMKRFLLAAALIPLSRYLYDYAALGIALINSHILNIDSFRIYAVKAVGTLFGLASTIGLLGGWAFLMGLIFVAFFLLILGAMRFLLIAALAVLLPIALAFTIFPLSFVRNVGVTLISMLVNLMIATIVCSAIFALPSYMSFGGSSVDMVMQVIIYFACLLAPALSLVIAPRASIGLYVTGMFMGYAFKPWISRLAHQLYPQLRHGIAALEKVPGVGRVVRVGTSIYRLSKQPGGVPYHVYTRVREWYSWRSFERRYGPIPRVPWDVLEGRVK